jgi:hypothetical protein
MQKKLPLNKTIAAGVVLAVGVVAVTPLCGFIFECGCTWPWQGLDADCNIHLAAAPHRCPWCASLAAGWSSAGSSVLAGVVACWYWRVPVCRGHPFEAPLRVLFGVGVFIVAALATGFVAALTQHYPLGIFGV